MQAITVKHSLQPQGTRFSESFPDVTEEIAVFVEIQTVNTTQINPKEIIFHKEVGWSPVCHSAPLFELLEAYNEVK